MIELYRFPQIPVDRQLDHYKIPYGTTCRPRIRGRAKASLISSLQLHELHSLDIGHWYDNRSSLFDWIATPRIRADQHQRVAFKPNNNIIISITTLSLSLACLFKNRQASESERVVFTFLKCIDKITESSRSNSEEATLLLHHLSHLNPLNFCMSLQSAKGNPTQLVQNYRKTSANLDRQSGTSGSQVAPGSSKCYPDPYLGLTICD